MTIFIVVIIIICYLCAKKDKFLFNS